MVKKSKPKKKVASKKKNKVVVPIIPINEKDEKVVDDLVKKSITTKNPITLSSKEIPYEFYNPRWHEKLLGKIKRFFKRVLLSFSLFVLKVGQKLYQLSL